MVDHYRWRSLDELIPVRLTQPLSTRPAGWTPTIDDVREAVAALQEKRAWGRGEISDELHKAVGVDRNRERIVQRPDTWVAVIRFCEGYPAEPAAHGDAK